MDWQEQHSEPNELTVNGRFLKHYIITLERLQETFDMEPKEGLPTFNKFVAYLRSIINDKKRIQKIDQAMIREKERINSPEFCSLFPDIDQDQKEFMIGFKVVNGCMKYVIRSFNVTRQGKDMSGENGLLLEHYLMTMEKMQGTFNQTSTRSFNLFIYYLRSLITVDTTVDEIDKDMEAIRRSPGEMDAQREYEIGFRVISGIMAYIDTTMKINKRQTKVCADQTDPNMPAPYKAGEEPDDDND